jgi:hypothetical protein
MYSVLHSTLALYIVVNYEIAGIAPGLVHAYQRLGIEIETARSQIK